MGALEQVAEQRMGAEQRLVPQRPGLPGRGAAAVGRRSTEIGGLHEDHRLPRPGPLLLERGQDLGVVEAPSEGREGIVAEQAAAHGRSEEHTSELQSLMRISYAVFCLKKKKNT